MLAAARDRSYTAPVLSPADTLLQGEHPAFDVAAVQRAGFPVVVWTVNDPGRMRDLLSKRVDGVISDRPDLLRQQVIQLGEAGDPYFIKFDAQGHRGGRDLRPENTLPAFESGLDNLITTIETDTGVTRDGVSLISHEQFINPQTCRASDGSAYTAANQVWIHDVPMAEAAERFICDKVFRGPQQKNNLALSPVSVAFAHEHKMINPYAPTNVAQLFEFVDFYVNFYRNVHPERAANAEKVRFNLETKITPEAKAGGKTVGAERFAQTLADVITAHKMERRADIQSFDFRTLEYVQRHYRAIRTVYLIESMAAVH